MLTEFTLISKQDGSETCTLLFVTLSSSVEAKLSFRFWSDRCKKHLAVAHNILNLDKWNKLHGRCSWKHLIEEEILFLHLDIIIILIILWFSSKFCCSCSLWENILRSSEGKSLSHIDGVNFVQLTHCVVCFVFYFACRGRPVKADQGRRHTDLWACWWHQTLQCAERPVGPL